MTVFNLNRLKAERIARSITQEEMAQKLGMERTSYWKRERGDVKLTVEEFVEILKVFEMTKEDMLIFFNHNVPEKQLS